MDKKAFMNALSSQLADWQKELNDLSAKANKAGTKAKAEIQNQIKDLNSKMDEAQSKLKQIQEVGDEAWDSVREGFEKSWTEFRGAFKNALSRFKL